MTGPLVVRRKGGGRNRDYQAAEGSLEPALGPTVKVGGEATRGGLHVEHGTWDDFHSVYGVLAGLGKGGGLGGLHNRHGL